MKKAELIADLQKRVVKIDKQHDTVNSIGENDNEYTFEVTVEPKPNVYRPETVCIRVIDEGLETERAGYTTDKIVELTSDLDIGAALLKAKYPEAKVIGPQGDRLYKIKLNNEYHLAGLNPTKDDLVLFPSE